MLGISSWDESMFTVDRCTLQDVKAGIDLNDDASGNVAETKFSMLEEGAFWAWQQIRGESVVGEEEGGGQDERVDEGIGGGGNGGMRDGGGERRGVAMNLGQGAAEPSRTCLTLDGNTVSLPSPL